MSSSCGASVTALLRCPICKTGLEHLTEPTHTFICENDHTFDVSKHGYVTLLPGDADQKTGDSIDMVLRRSRFHKAGYYQTLKQRLGAIAAENNLRMIADVGSGPGYYSAQIIAQNPEICCADFDLSKKALQHAVKLSPQIIGIVADTWAGLPCKDESFDAVFNIFAPRDAREFKRILKPGGLVIVVTPAPDHFQEIRDAADLIRIGRRDKTKGEELREKFEPYFTPVSEELLEEELTLTEKTIEDLVMMGPNAHHTKLSELRGAIATLPRPLKATMRVHIRIFQKGGS